MLMGRRTARLSEKECKKTHSCNVSFFEDLWHESFVSFWKHYLDVYQCCPGVIRSNGDC